MLQITKNLRLLSIQENNCQDNELIAVVCFFDFFNESGAVYVTIDSIDDEYPSYAMKESDSELFDSFDDLTDEHWDVLRDKIKEFKVKWDSDNKYE